MCQFSKPPWHFWNFRITSNFCVINIADILWNILVRNLLNILHPKIMTHLKFQVWKSFLWECNIKFIQMDYRKQPWIFHMCLTVAKMFPVKIDESIFKQLEIKITHTFSKYTVNRNEWDWCFVCVCVKYQLQKHTQTHNLWVNKEKNHDRISAIPRIVPYTEKNRCYFFFNENTWKTKVVQQKGVPKVGIDVLY